MSFDVFLIYKLIPKNYKKKIKENKTMIIKQKTLRFFFKLETKQKNNRNFLKNTFNFASWNEQIKKDMESKNSYQHIDLDNPFSDVNFDSQTTDWRRYWNINDNSDVQFNVY